MTDCLAEPRPYNLLTLGRTNRAVEWESSGKLLQECAEEKVLPAEKKPRSYLIRDKSQFSQIFTNYTSGGGLISKIQKELRKLNNEN